MYGIDWVQLCFGIEVSLILHWFWPEPDQPTRYHGLPLARFAAISACGIYIASPAFPLTAARVGWPWCILDDLVVSIFLIWCILKSSNGPKSPGSAIAPVSGAGRDADITLTGGF